MHACLAFPKSPAELPSPPEFAVPAVVTRRLGQRAGACRRAAA